MLTTKLNKDILNSDKPPSTDAPRKKNLIQRKPSGKKTGGGPIILDRHSLFPISRTISFHITLKAAPGAALL